ncbi:MAG TPA: NADPH-dependent FMN reductase [Casimicrobiaceae bacterium]
MKVLGLPGSLRTGSHNLALLRAAALELPPGAELAIWDRIGELPIYDPELDVEPAHPVVQDLRDAIAGADAVLVSTPEYNGSLPGGLKNALDWASRPFATNVLRDKPAGAIGATTGLFGAVWAQAEARKVLNTIGARVIEHEVPVGLAHEAFDEGGRLKDDLQAEMLRDAVGALVREVRAPLEVAA